MKIKLSALTIYKCIFVILLFQDVLQNNISNPILNQLISYFDESIVFISLLYIVYCFLVKVKVLSYEKQLFTLFALYISIGIVSTLCGMEVQILPAVLDCFTCSKFFIIFIGVSFLCRRNSKIKKMICELDLFCRVTLIFFLILIILNMIFQIFPDYGNRMGIPIQMLFFSHPSYLGSSAIFCCVIILHNGKKNELAYMIIATLLTIFSMRIRMLAIQGVIWIVYLYLIKFKLKSKIMLSFSAIGIAILIGVEQFQNYYYNFSETRSIVTVQGMKLAFERFPFGTGFASFASNMAREYYSKLYYRLGFQRIWGLNAENDTFLTDQFWAAVIAQFGWIGCIIFILMLFLLLKRILKFSSKQSRIFAVASVLYIYELINSLGDTAYFHPQAVMAFSLLALLINKEGEIV